MAYSSTCLTEYASSNEGAGMKPINVYPMIMMLIVVLFLIFWLWGGLS